ncbi:MAG: hypothetical protein LBG63_02835 [Candidatus Methanoplasma sp.]|jgi:hypothetical protein|nr:hypothetical protein [Candidatus Methanoplasma sp.]
MNDAKYRITTEYDDGFESVKEFDSLEDAKSYFNNIDERDIRSSVICRCGDDSSEEIARKEGKQRK